MSINKPRNVRIISGSMRGSKILFPAVPGLRPTGDRVRETLFAWLQSIIVDSNCLDMFAGSGALGLEAASRGAEQVILVEKNRTASGAISENANRLGFDNIKVLAADALNDTVYRDQTIPRQFNLVFIDPPFSENLHAEAIECVVCNDLLMPDAWVYLESGRKGEPIQVPQAWDLHREKLAGEVRMQLYHVIAGV